MSPSCLLSVHVIPRAKKHAVSGQRGETLVVRLAAPPVDGAANDALVRVLADWLDVPRRQVTLVQGERSREKVIRVEGWTRSDAIDRLLNLK